MSQKRFVARPDGAPSALQLPPPYEARSESTPYSSSVPKRRAGAALSEDPRGLKVEAKNRSKSVSHFFAPSKIFLNFFDRGLQGSMRLKQNPPEKKNAILKFSKLPLQSQIFRFSVNPSPRPRPTPPPPRTARRRSSYSA